MSKVLIGTGLVLIVALQGCRSTDDRRAKCAAIRGVAGAGVGAAIGSKTGSWGWGAGIGAVAGAALGYAIADSTDDHDRHRERDGRAVVYGPPPAAPQPPPMDEETRRRREEADRDFQIAMESKDSTTAEYHLKKSIEEYPTPAAHNNLGILYLNAGDREAARFNFRQAIVLDPHYEPALQNLEKLGNG